MFIPPSALAEVSREEAIRIASKVRLIQDGLRGVELWQAATTPPSELSGSWGVTFHTPNHEKPLLGARVDARSGEVTAVWWDPDAFYLYKKPESSLWSAEQLTAAKAQSPSDVQDAVGDFLRQYLAEHRKAQMRVEYLPEARRWLVSVHEEEKALGYVTYADGRIVDVHLLGFNWTPEKPAAPIFNLGGLVPRFNAITVLVIALILGFLCFGDRRRFFGPRNRRLAILYGLFAVGLVLNPSPVSYAWAMVVVIVLFAWMIREERDPVPVEPEVAPKALWIAVAAGAAMLSIAPVWFGEVGDSSRCAGIGARYIMQERRMPYGADIAPTGYVPHDRNTYGPVFYLVHIPAEIIVPTTYQHEGIRSKIGEMGWTKFINRATMRETASRITITFFSVLFLAGVWVMGARAGGARFAGGWVALSALGPATMTYMNGGHVISAAFVVWALVFLARPLLAGALLGLGAATLFYPAFAIPLWIGWYARNRRGVAAFVVGVGVVGLAILGLTLAFTQASSLAVAFRIFLRDTVLYQETAQGMAGKGWGFWPSFPALAAILHGPVIVAYLLFCIGVAFWPRLTLERDLVAWTAAVFIGTQFWKSFGPGYAEWYLYLVVMALFWPKERNVLDQVPQPLASSAPGGGLQL